MAHKYNDYPPSESRRTGLLYIVGKLAVNLFAFGLAVVGCYLLLTLFDTPEERRAKEENQRLNREFEALSARYDTLSMVMDNIVERDRNVFKILFESEPYDFDDSSADSRWDNYERLQKLSEKELFDEFTSKLAAIEEKECFLDRLCRRMAATAEGATDLMNGIPAIQPVLNNDLTLLTASYGMRIHPFYKSLVSHQGVDYTVPVGSRVFATADGTVIEVAKRNTTSGLNIVIAHRGGYETQYSHLSRIDVKKGQKVRRGDIIALTGNTGLSLSPHLHYEVRYNGMRVDPVHYFFMELSPNRYQRMLKIAQSGMQSFD